jgi:uncharacterized protein
MIATSCCVLRRGGLTAPQRLPSLCAGHAPKTVLTTHSFRRPYASGSTHNQKLLPDNPKKNNNNNNSNNTTSVVDNPSTTTTESQKQSQEDIARYIVPTTSFVIGTCAGIMGSLAGMGGGFIMIPLMTSSRLSLNLTQHQAHGTSLFAVAATGVAGAWGYQGHVQYEAAAAIATCGIVTAGIGASVTTHMSSHNLKRVLGIFMILVAPIIPLKGYSLQQQQQQQQQELDNNNENEHRTENNEETINAVSHESNKEKEPLVANYSSVSSSSSSSSSSWQQRLLPPAIIGLGSGFLAGLLGVGGGAVVVPALTMFTDVNHYQALGTSLCAMAFPAIAGTITHFRKGNVAMRVAPALAAGAFCGGYLGGRLGKMVQEDALRWGFSGLMITLGVRTLLR